MKEEGRNWIEFASEDLKIAELALHERVYNQACFHSQQCVEKALKGLIAFRGRIHPQTHKLADIFSILFEKTFDDLKNDILLLDRFYIPTRYPDALPGNLPQGLPTEIDAQEALRVAKIVLERAKKAMGI